jgi:hypothetical protein
MKRIRRILDTEKAVQIENSELKTTAGAALLSPARRIPTWILTTAVAIVAILAPSIASAGPILVIDEGIGLPNPLTTEGTLGVVTQYFTSGNGLVFTVVQEVANGLGSVNASFEFFVNPAVGPPVGQTTTANTNFFDTFGGLTISDTISVMLTGHLVDANGNNVSAHVMFLSGSLGDTLLPTPLPNASALSENGYYTNVNTGVLDTDLRVTVRSDEGDVLESPEPSTSTLVLAGFGFCAGSLRFRKGKAKQSTLLSGYKSNNG